MDISRLFLIAQSFSDCFLLLILVIWTEIAQSSGIWRGFIQSCSGIFSIMSVKVTRWLPLLTHGPIMSSHWRGSTVVTPLLTWRQVAKKDMPKWTGDVRIQELNRLRRVSFRRWARFIFYWVMTVHYYIYDFKEEVAQSLPFLAQHVSLELGIAQWLLSFPCILGRICAIITTDATC